MTSPLDMTRHRGVGQGAEDEADLVRRGEASRGRDRRAVAAGSLLGVAALLAMALSRIGATPLWLDEAYSLGVANQFAYGVKETGGTMFLYYSLLWPWARIAQNTVWIRLLSTLIAVLAMPVFAALARRIGGRRAALLAPPLLGASYFFPLVASDARSYSLEAFILIVGWYALVRAIEAGTDTPAAHRWWVVLTLVGPLGVLAHGLFPLFTATWCLAAVLSPKPRRAIVKLLPMLGATLAFLVLLFAMGISAVGDWVPPSNFQYVKVATFQYIGTYHSLQAVTLVCTVTLAWVAVRAWRRTLGEPADAPERLSAWRVGIPLIWVLVPPILLLFISMARATFVSRYLSAIAPGIALVVAVGLGELIGAVAKRRGRLPRYARKTVAFGVVGVVLVGAFGLTNYRSLEHADSEQWDEVATLLVRDGRPSDGIILYSDFSRPPLESQLAQIEHGPLPHIVNAPRQFGRPMRIDQHIHPTYTNRRKLVVYRRIWTIEVGTDEIEQGFYAKSPPLATNYRVARTWHFRASRPAVIRLYVRVTPIDYLPLAG
jgi:hypothetical protein